MRKLAVMAAALCLATLPGCSSDDAPAPRGDDLIVGKQWQVTNLYTTPEARSAIAPDTAQVPHMSFGEHTVVGSTGCVPFTAEVSFTEGEKDSTIWDADGMLVEKVDYESVAAGEECTGSAQWADKLLHSLIAQGHEFDFKLNQNNQLVLTLRTDKVDSPIIRMASL